MVSNCLKECLLNLWVVSPTEVEQRHQGDIIFFFKVASAGEGLVRIIHIFLRIDNGYLHILAHNTSN